VKNGKHLKTGSDPRALPDYVSLRDEMLKLTHPARPDVNWRHAESLCLRLFEHNGVELQTAAWFTLARSHITGVGGLNEGLALTGALLAHQWSLFWPGNAHARVEILSGLFTRLQNVFRTLALSDSQDLALLYLCEKQLTALCDTLSRHELKQASRADVLLQQVKQAITRLENAPHEAAAEPAVVLPAQSWSAPQVDILPANERLVYVVPPEPMVDVMVADPGAGRRVARAFIAGVACTLVVGGAALWGWHALHQLSPAEQRFTAALTPLPGALSSEQTVALRQQGLPVEQGLAQLQTQLKWLATQSPDWSLRYGQQMIHQAQMLWPESPQVAAVQSGWQQQIAANALPLDALHSWHDGRAKLQQLTGRLNGLDEKRGKYMTVSELKTEVFGVMQTFNQYPPAEEQLRQLEEMRKNKTAAATQQMQTEMRLKQLLSRYALINDQSQK
jgi:type VI secretion system protein VasL